MAPKNPLVDSTLSRRRFMQAGASAVMGASLLPLLPAHETVLTAQQPVAPLKAQTKRLVPPDHGKIPVALIVGQGGAETIDFVGPMEALTFATDPNRGTTMEDMQPFEMFTVSSSTTPIRVTGGMRIVPDYTFAEAPAPKVLVVPATRSSPEMLDWIRRAAKSCDVVMSVCLGVVHLAEAGLLEGKQAAATVIPNIQKKFPGVQFVRNRRWVQSDSVIYTSGPTGAGIDLTLHIVDLYFGRNVALRAAFGMNYPGRDWMGDGTDTNQPPPSA